MKAYKICNWEERFKSHSDSESSAIQGGMKDFNAHKEAHAYLAQSKEGVVAMAVWVVLLRLAAKMPEPGLLINAQGPLTISDLSKKTGLPAPVFKMGLKLLMHPQVNWVELVDCPKMLIDNHKYDLDPYLKDPQVLAPNFEEEPGPEGAFDDFIPKLEVPGIDHLGGTAFEDFFQGNFYRHSVEWFGQKPDMDLRFLNEDDNNEGSSVVDHAFEGRPWGNKTPRIPVVYLTEGEALKKIQALKKRLGKEPELN
ncbi:MAG TPA: hypothetical protein DIU37_05345 [Opitutae bacterium]|nr:hypothetical protein [Opitutae bacterium]